jgi:hypothetical protein
MANLSCETLESSTKMCIIIEYYGQFMAAISALISQYAFFNTLTYLLVYAGFTPRRR